MRLPQLLCLAATLACAAPACAAAPLLVPTQDVTVTYAVAPRDHAPLTVQAEIEAGGRRLRITSADLPTAFLIDRVAGQATILLPMLKLYAGIGIAHLDPERTVLRRARFEPHGQERIAGLFCTDWTAISPQGRAQGCITPDGIILSGQAEDRHGGLATIRALSVRPLPLPPPLFQMPDGYTNAGTLPIDGFGAPQ